MPTITVRFALALDAVASLATALLLLAITGVLAPLLALPEALLRGCGAFFLPWAALCAWLARHPAPSRRAVAWVASLNAAWALASVLVLLSGLLAPSTLGAAFILFQAAAVALFAALQALALRTGHPTLTQTRGNQDLQT
jgi:hypothetical protein